MINKMLDIYPSKNNDRSEKFVVIADIEIKKERESEFKIWFADSNKIILKFDGLVCRNLLQSADGKNDRILLVCNSKGDFMKMYNSQEHHKLHQSAIAFMSKRPVLSFYDVVV